MDKARQLRANQGFTLMELLVVMAIMVILGIGTVIGFNLLNTGNSKRTTDRIHSILEYVQMENMSKNKIYSMVIEKDSTTNDYYISVVTVNSTGGMTRNFREKLDLRNGEITFQNKGDSTVYFVSPVLGGNNRSKLEVSFLKDSGGIRPNSLNEIVLKITVTASERTHSITLVEKTGSMIVD